MVLAKGELMWENDGVAAALWASLGAATLGLSRWIATRLLVPRDAVQKKLLEDISADIAVSKDRLCRLTDMVHMQGERIAAIEGKLGRSGDGR